MLKHNKSEGQNGISADATKQGGDKTNDTIIQTKMMNELLGIKKN